MTSLFFHHNPQAGFELMQKQLADGWSWADIEQYFLTLGYERTWIVFMAGAIRADKYLTKVIEG
jgi:hypothetical protein